MAQNDPKKPDWTRGAPFPLGEDTLGPERAALLGRLLRESGPEVPQDWTARPGHAGPIVPLPGSGYLDALFLDFPFPVDREAVVCYLAGEAQTQGGPAEFFHDLAVQVEQPVFQSIHDLKRALGERFAWEGAHNLGPGGSDGR